MTRSLGSRVSAALGRPPASGSPSASAGPVPALPRQRSVGLDDLLAEGTALLGSHRDARRT